MGAASGFRAIGANGMNATIKVKIIIDFAMTLFLLFLMAYHVTGETAHMIFGAALCALIIVHLVLNRGWIRTIRKGRYNTVRIIRLVFNVLLFFTMAGLLTSGVMMSPVRRLFGYSLIGLARTIHHVLAYWGFVLASIHIGLYVKKITGMVWLNTKKNERRTYAKVLRCVVTVLIAAYGIYAFVNHEIYSSMLFISEFTFIDYSQPVYLFVLDYLAVMGLFIIIAHCSSGLVSKCFSNKA